MTKYALTITPVVLSLEELIPSSSRKMKSKGASMLFRTVLVLSTLVVALTVPFFGKLSLSLSLSHYPSFFLKKPIFRNTKTCDNLVIVKTLTTATVAALIGSFIAMLIVSL